MAAFARQPFGSLGPNLFSVAPKFLKRGIEKDVVVRSDEVFEKAKNGGFFFAESGEAEGIEELSLLLRVVLLIEEPLVDELAGLRALVLVEHGDLAAKPEFGGVGADDAGKKGVESAEEEARHALDEEREKFAVVGGGELRKGRVKWIGGGAGELLGGFVGLGSAGEFFEDFFEEFTSGFAGEGDGDDALGLGSFAGEEIASEEGEVAVGELEGFS